MTSLMTKRLLCLFALLALTACAQPEDMLSDSMGASKAAPEPAPAPVMVEEAPMVLERSDVSAEECTGDGIGGTGCPTL